MDTPDNLLPPPLALVSLEDAARQLQLSPRQLAALALRGEIDAAKLGRKWVFDQEGIRGYYERQRTLAKYRRIPETAEQGVQETPPVWGRRT